LLLAVDELHDDLVISAGTLARLRGWFDDRQLVEICFITGHYELLAMALESIGLPYDGWRPERPSACTPLARRRRQPSTSRCPAPLAGLDPPSSPGPPPLAWFPMSPTATTVLSAQPRLHRLLLLFARNSLRFATLAPRHHELAVLRTLWTCGPDEEWSHHAAVAPQAGLDEDDIERVSVGPDALGWQSAEAALLRAVDELDSDYFVSDQTWPDLAGFLDARQLIELCFLVGHVRTFSMLVNTLGDKR
jgi:alkylhydroperoxidase family enzyme